MVRQQAPISIESASKNAQEKAEITIRIFEPAQPPDRNNNLKQQAYVNFHGGGWVTGFGDLSQSHPWMVSVNVLLTDWRATLWLSTSTAV